MGFGGGQSTPTQFNPEPSNPYPQLQGGLVNASQDALAYFRPYGVYGAGYQMANQSPMGQIYTPGPNQSLFGNPYTTAGHTPGFGQSPQYPSEIGFGSGAGGGYGGSGGSGGMQNSNAGAKLSGYVPPPAGNLPAGRAYTQGSDLLGALRSALATQITPPPGNPGAGAPPTPRAEGAGGAPLPYWATPREPELSQHPQAPASGGGSSSNNSTANSAGTPQPPAPPTYSVAGGVATDPYGIAAGNAPVGANGQPMTVEQMQALQQQTGMINPLAQGGK